MAEEETAIRDLLARRGVGKTICPSEAARALWQGTGARDWRNGMGRIRAAAAAMAARGEVEVTQKGRVVSIETARGPVRLRLIRS